MLARNWMGKDVITINVNDPLINAIKLLNIISPLSPCDLRFIAPTVRRRRCAGLLQYEGSNEQEITVSFI